MTAASWDADRCASPVVRASYVVGASEPRWGRPYVHDLPIHLSIVSIVIDEMTRRSQASVTVTFSSMQVEMRTCG